MKTIILAVVTSIALSASVAFAKGQDNRLLNDLNRTSATVSVHGVFDGR